jgi:hypothetical protein
MIRRVANAVRLFLLVQWRCGFPLVYAALALATILAFRTLVPPGLRAWLLPVFLLTEPGMLGFALVAAQGYLERGSQSADALAITPLTSVELASSLACATASIAAVAGVAVQAGVLGVDWRLALLAPVLFLTALLSGLAGLALSTRHAEFTRFIVNCLIPGATLIQLPLLAYFELVPRLSFAWIPSDAGLFAFALLTQPQPHLPELGLYVLLLLAWAAVALRWSARRLDEQLRGAEAP